MCEIRMLYFQPNAANYRYDRISLMPERVHSFESNNFGENKFLGWEPQRPTRWFLFQNV